MNFFVKLFDHFPLKIVSWIELNIYILIKYTFYLMEN